MTDPLSMIGEHLWEGLAETDSRWARIYTALLAALRPGEYVTLGLRHPLVDLAAGTPPSMVLWAPDDDAIVVEITGNAVLCGPMKLTGQQECQLETLGFARPGPSPWFPHGQDMWRLVGGFLDLPTLGALIVTVIAEVMHLAHPLFAPVCYAGSTEGSALQPCLHMLTCTCSAALGQIDGT